MTIWGPRLMMHSMWIAACCFGVHAASAPAPRISITGGPAPILSWQTRGALETAAQITRPWTRLTNASSPYTNVGSGNTRFYRLNQTVEVTCLRNSFVRLPELVPVSR